ncbi:MAG: glycosyltransferase family 2 protein [Dehalococcoidia bacterium]|nr:glycosyltransferase family 2 protein [Dehalococcoidia bacterium]
MAKATDGLPFVSVLIPMRNEERYIGPCLRSLARQDYPRDRFEVLVMDGASTDRSRELAQNVAQSESLPLRLIDNPGRSTARGLNLGLREARGDVIVRVDAHTAVAPDFLTESVAALRETDADGVGGPIESVGEGLVGEAIALAMSSPFGVGNAHFRYSRETLYTDTVAFPAYHRKLFDEVGPFAEDIEYGEDDEFNYRLGDAGKKLLLTPRIRSTYFTRSSFAALFRQYLGYGRAKVEVLRRHPRRARLRQFVPAIFVGTLAALSALSLVCGASRRALAVVALSYLAASLAFSVRIASRRGWRYLPLLPAAFACLHVAYGIGFLWSLARTASNKTSTRPDFGEEVG